MFEENKRQAIDQKNAAKDFGTNHLLYAFYTAEKSIDHLLLSFTSLYKKSCFHWEKTKEYLWLATSIIGNWVYCFCRMSTNKGGLLYRFQIESYNNEAAKVLKCKKNIMRQQNTQWLERGIKI